MSWLKRRLPKKKWKRVCIYLASTLLILLAADAILAAYWRHIDIAAGTTQITGPLGPDGMPDYVAALNARASEGVTPENNAAPELLRIIGLTMSSPRVQEKILSPLGMPADPLPPQFTSYTDWRKTQPEEKDEDTTQSMSEMLKRPWKTSEHPLWARWLQEQSHAIPPALKAVEKPHLYIPYAAADGYPVLIHVLIPYLSSLRNLTRLLLADAMHHLGENDSPAALADLVAALKLSRLLDRSACTMIESSVAAILEDMTYTAIEAAAFSPAPAGPSDAQTRDLLHTIDQLGPLDIRFTYAERWFVLDAVCSFAAHGPITNEGEPTGFFARAGMALAPIHYNALLRDANAYFDQMDRAYGLADYPARRDALHQLEADLRARENRSLVGKIANPTRAIGDLFFAMLAPAAVKFAERQEQSRVQRDLARLTLALRIYKSQHAGYPDNLNALAPAILPSIPEDSFADTPLKYRREANGFLLYSVGPDGVDDGGTPRDSHGHGWDIVVRTPE